MKQAMKILVAYDGSECGNAALQDLKRAGLSAESEVLVMSLADVLVPPSITGQADDTGPVYVPESVKRAHERARHILEEAEGLAKRASEQIKAMFPRWRVSYTAEAD